MNRNVISCPAPTGDPVRDSDQQLADAVAAHLAPRGGAYHEIWLNGEKVSEPPTDPEAAEPIYGKVYLPRKFKIGFALPDDNCTDVLAQCLGFLAVVENGQPVGYNLYAGGGQGHDATASRHLPAPGAAGLLRRAGRGGRGGRGGRASCSATTATAPTASGPGSST